MLKYSCLATAACVLALGTSAASAAGAGKYCLKGPGSTMNCTYQTMASCDKAKTGSQTRVPNPSTTGSGSSGDSTNSMKK
jgi:Protein of unknown function (DUF3551)